MMTMRIHLIKDCEDHDEEVNACIFTGTPDSWDPYGRKKDHLVDENIDGREKEWLK